MVMLQLSGALINQPVLSLRTGAEVATALTPIINPNNLKIEGFYCQDRYDKKQLILVAIDIREILPQGLVVNDYDVLAEPEELVRLQEVMQINFQLLGKPVVTISKERVGKVDDFAADSNSLYVQKLYVTQSILKSFSGGQLSIDRNQIVEITNKKIIIQELMKPQKGAMPAISTG